MKLNVLRWAWGRCRGKDADLILRVGLGEFPLSFSSFLPLSFCCLLSEDLTNKKHHKITLWKVLGKIYHFGRSKILDFRDLVVCVEVWSLASSVAEVGTRTGLAGLGSLRFPSSLCFSRFTSCWRDRRASLKHKQQKVFFGVWRKNKTD